MQVIFRKILIFRKYYFSEKKIFLSVWLYFRKCCEKYFLVFGYIVENAIFLQIFSHGNSTHDDKLRQSKATTTNTPPPQQQKSKSQRERERERSVGRRSVGRRRDRRCDGCGVSGAMQSSDWSSRDRAVRCDHRTGAHEIERCSANVRLAHEIDW